MLPAHESNVDEMDNGASPRRRSSSPSSCPSCSASPGTAHALEALAAVLGANHVFDDLSERDAGRVAGNLTFDVIRAGFDLTAAADAITDWADEVLVDRRGGWDDRSAASHGDAPGGAGAVRCTNHGCDLLAAGGRESVC
jgi:hypothetical protein